MMSLEEQNTVLTRVQPGAAVPRRDVVPRKPVVPHVSHGQQQLRLTCQAFRPSTAVVIVCTNDVGLRGKISRRQTIHAHTAPDTFPPCKYRLTASTPLISNMPNILIVGANRGLGASLTKLY